MKADLMRLLDMIEHGYTISLVNPESGEVVFYDAPEKIKRDYSDSEHVFEITDLGGKYATAQVKKDYEGEPIFDTSRMQEENQTLLTLADSLARKYGATGEAMDAVSGYLMSKLETLKKRLVKYYGFQWLDWLKGTSSIHETMVRFIQGQLRSTIESIVLSYVNKSNYVHEGKVHHLNVNIYPTTQAEDEEETEPPAGDKFSEPAYESVAGEETRRLKREKPVR